MTSNKNSQKVAIDSPTAWFAVLERARLDGDFERADYAMQELRRLGVNVAFGDDLPLLHDFEAAKLLKTLTARLVKWARAGRVPHILLPDGEIRFRRSDLSQWVDEFFRPASDPTGKETDG